MQKFIKQIQPVIDGNEERFIKKGKMYRGKNLFDNQVK